MCAMTPIRLSGNVQVGRGLNDICIDAGLLITRDSSVPDPRLMMADWPLKIPLEGAVSTVVTPAVRPAFASSSAIFALRIARESGVGSARFSPFADAKP